MTSTDLSNVTSKYMISSDSENGVLGFNRSGSAAKDPLSIVLTLSGLDPHAPASMYSLSVMVSLFLPKDAWIAVGNINTMNEWAENYIKFGIGSDGLLFDPRNLNGRRALGITNPVTGRIILAPALFNGKKSNYGLGDVIIHEGKHFLNWKNGMFQGNHPLMSNLDEISAYITAGEWTGAVDSGINNYLFDISNYLLKMQNIIK